MTWQRRRITGRHLVHWIRGVTCIFSNSWIGVEFYDVEINLHSYLVQIDVVKIHHHCHVICLRVAFCNVIMCIALHCIRVRLMHPSIFPVVRFAIRHSYVLRRSPFVSCCERVLNFLGMARGLPSGLGIAPVDRLSSFVPFGDRLILQRLTG